MRSGLIGTGIFLLVVGAILNFAVADMVKYVDLHMVGLIMMGGGVLSILLSFFVSGGGYNATTTSTVNPATGTRVDDVRVD